ncbi:MAG TPA: DUF4350 domain-containing protein [Gemmatimonadaceae bacterium]|nr:DUF4350 domain-containing protein [Gemmatimonadaceae bacterium]
MAERRGSRWLRPRYIFAFAVLVVIATLLFTPASDLGANSYAITTFSARPWGARGVYEISERLGWKVERRVTSLDTTLDSHATYVILDPAIPLSAADVGSLLRAVRAGGRALVSPGPGLPLADSLGVHRSSMRAFGSAVVGDPDVVGERQAQAEAISRAAMYVGRFDFALVTDSAVISNASTLAHVKRDDEEEPAIMSLRIGDGEIVAIADPTFVRNVVARRGSGTVLLVRLLEWLDPARERPLVFDEYHQGFGVHENMPRAIRDALFHTAPGRVVVQLVAAGLILLLVYGVRPLAPLKRRSIERRSPLEHVGALARAYQQSEATRAGTQRLLRGLRRRRPLGATGSLDDDSYLSLVISRKPELADDVERVRAALVKPLPASEWVAVGSAIDHIERTIAQ